jgi:hypothetical protein
MEKPRIPTKAELKQEKSKGRKGITKHFVLDWRKDKLVSEYAKKLDVPQAVVMNEMMEVGIYRFEVNHGFRLKEKSLAEEKERMTTAFSNEQIRLILEEKRRKAGQKSKEIEDAYSRSIAHGNSDDWQTV